VSHEGERTTIHGTNLDSGQQGLLYRTAVGVHAGIDVHDFLVLDLPPGFVHVTESVPVGEDGAVVNVRQRELLVSVGDGRQVEIPPAPFRPPTGFGTQG
jgi:hypothetical protein